MKMDELLQTPEGKLQIAEINKQFPANVSQLEKALVASGSLKGKTGVFLTIYRHREWKSTRNDRKQGMHSHRYSHQGWYTIRGERR